MSDETKRTVTFTWENPLESAEIGRGLDGLSYLKKMQTGEVPPPPIMRLMNAKDMEVEAGRVVFTAEPMEYHFNPIGSVHGGFAATWLDSCMGCAIHSILPLNSFYTTLELKINYIRGISAKTGIVACEGKIIHVGGKVATAEGKITDSEGRLLAHGSTTCMIFRN